MPRLCLLVAAVALVWAALLVLTGGVVINVGGMVVSSRSPVNPLVLALTAVAAAWALSPRAQRTRVLADDLQKFGAPAVAVFLAVIVIATGLTRGALVAGGSDAYGYVSQADAWASGTLRFDEPLIREFAGRLHRDALVPLGYLPVGESGTVAPVYPPGFPLVMGVFQWLAGRAAVFYVVPLLAGVAVLATYVMGLRLAGATTGVLAAGLLATSPSFLFQLTAAPMSDIPVTAWWALALALLLFDSHAAALSAGLAAGMAVLTRPNLAPLALVVMVALLATAGRQRAVSNRGIQRALLFAAGVVPGCVVVGILNWFWYGSPLMSGYGPASGLYAWQNLGPNLLRYPGWVFESQSPVVVAAFAAPWLVTRVARDPVSSAEARPIALSWLCFVLAVLASYVFYEAFNAWWFVRFMLPAFPPLLVLTSVAIVAATARLSPWPRVLIRSALAAIVGWHGLLYAYEHDVFRATLERKYAIVGGYIARRLPSNAVLLSMLHSGSARYYSGRATVRFDLVPKPELDSTLSALAGAGYHPYFLLESWEVADFQRRFAGRSVLAPLDWPPIAMMRESRVRIYDPADRATSRAGQPPLTEIVP